MKGGEEIILEMGWRTLKNSEKIDIVSEGYCANARVEELGCSITKTVNECTF